MHSTSEIPHFSGEVIAQGDPTYDQHREVWNAIVDRRPAVIARCTSAADVAAAIRYGRDRGLAIGVRCGGHSILGLSVPDGGLMVDLAPMSSVEVDPAERRARVQGGSLLRNLDRGTAPHGLGTTAGNVSHTGVGGLTLGGGMGWLARRFGLACDNVEAYTVVTADGRIIRVTARDEPDLYWGLRGGGGNFGVVTEFEFRLHPFDGRVLLVELGFPVEDAIAPLRVWRDLLADAPREATLTADATTSDGRPIASVGFVWAGDPEAGRNYLKTFREVGEPLAERVEEMTYLELQSIADEFHHHGKRRYAKGHYLRTLPDAALEALVWRGVSPEGPEPDWSRVPNGGFQAYGGAIADVADSDSAFSHRATLVEWGGATSWLDPGEDDARIGAARAYGAAMEPFASGMYVNTIADEGAAGVRRAYDDAKLARLAELKRRYDPDNVFRLNHNISPSRDGDAP